MLTEVPPIQRARHDTPESKSLAPTKRNRTADFVDSQRMDVRSQVPAVENHIRLAHVHVPETSMDKDDGSESWQDDIWLARQVLAMKSEPVALRVQCFAN